MNSHGYDENVTRGPAIKRKTTAVSWMNNYHGNRTAIGCCNHNILIAFFIEYFRRKMP